MTQHVAPIACKPWALNGLSERLIVGHYEDSYGAAVRSVNAIRDTLNALDLAAAPGYQIRALKREELAAMGSVTLHEVYFGSLGGDGAVQFTGTGAGSKVPEAAATALEQRFGSVEGWRREFVALARALDGGLGWVVLNYSHRDGGVFNQIVLDHSQAALDAAPLLALDMYEHAYRLDFGANAAAYIDAFMRNVDWTAVAGRLIAARSAGPARQEHAADDPVPSISVEELRVKIADGEPLQVLDARPRHHFCAYGYAVGCSVAAALRERGFDAKFIKGGLSAWYAAGGARSLTAECETDNGGALR